MIEVKMDLTPIEIENMLIELTNEYARKIEELKNILIQEAEAKVKLSFEYSKEYLLAKTSKKENGKSITDKEAEAKANLATAELELNYEILKAQRRAIEESLNNISIEIELLRSIYSFRKVEYEKV
jgi:hypothetical protein